MNKNSAEEKRYHDETVKRYLINTKARAHLAIIRENLEQLKALEKEGLGREAASIEIPLVVRKIEMTIHDLDLSFKKIVETTERLLGFTSKED